MNPKISSFNDMERKLATIQKISELRPIEGADKIEVALMEGLGWECVVKKGDFAVGDRVVYIEVDSVMPERPEYEFLRPRNFRIKTIKLKGQVSQGLILDISSVPCAEFLALGSDVTDVLGITKYLSSSERLEFEEQGRRLLNEKNKLKKFMMRYSWFRRLFLSRSQKVSFPYWVSKTDEERIQNMPHVLEQFADERVYVTEKIDYQSVTFTGKMVPRFAGFFGKILRFKKFQFVVCSRNMVNNDKSSLYWKIAQKYNIEKILRENPTLTIQGEQGDAKIQGNKYKISEPKMWVFNIIDHEKHWHFCRSEMETFCAKYDLDLVPIVKQCKLSELGSTVVELVECSKGKSQVADIPREGIVVRSIHNGNKRLSFKVINPDFLLKYSE